MLRRQVLAQAEEQHIAALEGAARQLEEMAPRGRDERVPSPALGPARGVRRRRLGLGAHHVAPDTAQKPEAVAADALERGLMAIGRADPAARRGDDVFRDSSEQAPAVHARLALQREAQDEIVARHVREAAEIRDVGEFRAAGGKALVAAGGDAEGVADDDRARGALPEVELGFAAREPVRLDLAASPALAPVSQTSCRP